MVKYLCCDRYKEYCCNLNADHDGLHKEIYNNFTYASWTKDYSELNIASDPYEALDFLADEFVQTAKDRGFYLDNKINPSEDIVKSHEELSELWQTISKGKINDPSDKVEDMKTKMNGQFLTGAQEEAADIIIQNIKIIGRMKEFLGIKSIAEIVKFKNKYNKRREWKHGSK